MKEKRREIGAIGQTKDRNIIGESEKEGKR